jgi:hypothetical protein
LAEIGGKGVFNPPHSTPRRFLGWKEAKKPLSLHSFLLNDFRSLQAGERGGDRTHDPLIKSQVRGFVIPPQAYPIVLTQSSLCPTIADVCADLTKATI